MAKHDLESTTVRNLLIGALIFILSQMEIPVTEVEAGQLIDEVMAVSEKIGVVYMLIGGWLGRRKATGPLSMTPNVRTIKMKNFNDRQYESVVKYASDLAKTIDGEAL